jgi:hypothetical protein
MNKSLLTIMLYISVIGVIAFITVKYVTHTSPSPIPANPAITSTDQLAFCKLSDLVGVASFEGAAGSVYGALGIKNMSPQSCQIIGNNFVTVTHDAQNVSIEKQAAPGPDFITIPPGKSVYLKIRYPNGPQCNGTTISSAITLSYKFSPDELLTFKTAEGKSTIPIQTCKDNSAITTVQVWSISTSQN